MDVIHTALWVSELEETASFYEDVLGLDYHHQFTHEGVVNYYVGSELGAELQFKYDTSDDTPVEPVGIDHVAVSVDDTDHEFERIVEMVDPPVVTEPTDVAAVEKRVAFIEDPDGYVVELVGPI